MRFKKSLYALLMFLSSLALLEGALQIASSLYQATEKKVAPSITSADENIILCIGESTTAWGMQDSYPSQLQVLLDAKFPERKFRVVNEGVPGTDTAKIVARLPELLEKHRPHFVIFMMGINDSWSLSRPSWYSELKITRFLKLVNAALQNWNLERGSPPAPAPKGKQSIDPKIMPLLEKAREMKRLQKFSESERVLQEAARLSKNTSQISFDLALVKLAQGNLNAAEKLLDRYIDIEKSSDAAFEAAQVYYFQFGLPYSFEKIPAIKKFLERAIELDPKNLRALWLIGCGLSQKPETHDTALLYLNKAVQLGSDNPDIYISLSDILTKREQIHEAERILELGVKRCTQHPNIHLWTQLIEIERRLKNTSKMRTYLRLAEETFPNNPALKRNAFSDPRNFLQSSETLKNFDRAVAMTLEAHAIPIIAQYPTLSVDPLRKALSSYENVLFVENMKNFEHALARIRYENLFTDSFGISFGHFTKTGSTLVAQSILDAIKSQ